ncbi:MAG: ABC transporter ATP-binding protein [Spirochaetales bacterium]|nr:ABC transporter ATP-binding protein [Spirochaetales bacterium]
MIQVQNLTYTYPGGLKPAIEELSFKVNKGEILGMLGPSGAGKSTLQKCLFGLLQGYSGSIEFSGMIPGTALFREHIGVQFEFPNMYEAFTAVENLEFFGGFYSGEKRDIHTLLSDVGLEQDAGKKVGEFSKGMKIRLSFARAILHNPRVLFLDEPTSGLDPVYSDQLMSMIEREKKRGVTVLLTTHNMQVASRLADRLAFIVDGRLPLVDTPASLIHRYGEDRIRLELMKDGGCETLDFPLTDLGNNESFFAALRSGTPVSLHSQEATLDKVFAAVTGRTLNGRR